MEAAGAQKAMLVLASGLLIFRTSLVHYE